MQKTEQPTAKKLREARARGVVPRSRELGTAAVLLAAWAALAMWGGTVLAALVASWELALGAIAGEVAGGPGEVLATGLALGLEAIAPLLAALVVAGTLAAFVQVGPLFTLAPVAPRLERLDPARGLGELFTQRRLIEVLKSAAILAVIGVVCWLTLRESLRGVLALAGREADAAVAGASALVAQLLLRVGLAMAAIGVVDVVYQRWRHREDQKMTREEVERERRASEGDPRTRRARERAHRELAAEVALEEVRGADVVVVSHGTGRAIALRYDAEGAGVPEVVAVGRGEHARRIVDVAIAAQVPAAEDDALAGALARLDRGATIPEPLFEPVARHLHAVWERAR